MFKYKGKIYISLIYTCQASDSPFSLFWAL
uniref:Uncharacterized protein n=1 Tax=Anguilla anguilla TaxID=7936 RepID=A0A0E9RCA0_ANGAN